MAAHVLVQGTLFRSPEERTGQGEWQHEKGFTLSVYAPLALPVAALQELVERIRFE